MPRAASLPHIRKEPLAAGGGGGHDSYAAAVTGVQVADNEELCTTEILDDILGGGEARCGGARGRADAHWQHL